MPPDKPDERLIIETLSWQLQAVHGRQQHHTRIEDNRRDHDCRALRRRTAMPAFLAASMLSGYIAKGDPF